MILKACLVVILNLLAAATTHEAALLITNETDYQALLSFKKQIISDPFNVFHSWNDSVSLCSWTGVTCGKKHHRVTQLRLPSLKLAGSLSSSLGNISFLRVLNLNNNSFKGILPREMSNLFRLEILKLANNSFGGELPKNLSHFRSLSILSVYGNHLEGKIPVEVGTLPRINILSLDNNRFTGTIPRSFGNLSTITYLFLDYNDLHGDLPVELGQLPNLFGIDLSFNHLSGSIPTEIFNVSSIVNFAAVQNNLTGILPSEMFLMLPNLQGLYLSMNSFAGSIPSSISNASNLVLIDISLNYLVGSVPVNLGTSFNTLQVLTFQENRLGTEGGGDLRFITSLTNHTKLVELGAGGNILKGVLPNSMVNLSATLTTLDLSLNVISGIIPEGIGNLVNLGRFDVGTNELSGKIPNDVGKLCNLNFFSTFGNNISGRIPPSLGNLSSLTILSLGRNVFEGTVPASLGNCNSLLGLDLSENQLDGPIPQELLALPSLSIYLDLHRNNLTGPMPSQVGKLVNLGFLDLSENNIYGEIPATLGNCLMLETLHLQKNNFSGSIPSTLKNLRSMKSLDLSHNNLSGSVPSFLVGLPLAEYLNLSFNMFEGEVPNGGIFNNRSAVSLVGNHKLCGGPSIWEFPPCSSQKRQGMRLFHRSVVVAVSTTIAVSLLCVCVIIAVLYRSRKSRNQATISSSTEARYPRLSYSDLFQATDGFSSSNVLGEGSFGVVYRGVLRSNEEGQIIAVKVLKLDEERRAIKSFMAECEALRNIRHRNLIKTITSCSSIDFAGNEFKALVFEFMPNGSLEKLLHPCETGEGNVAPRLSLLERLNIAIDIAAALNYLHHLCHTPIIHCDLKANNVLLNSDMSARLSDFGLAKFLIDKVTRSHSQTSSIGIRGTLGYIAPEYGLGGEVSTHGDVYSFGILLLEMFTGKRPTDSMFGDNFELREYVAKAVSEDERLTKVVDPTLLHCEEEENPRRYEAMLYKCLIVVLKLGISCSAALPSTRMDIADAVLELRKARDLYLDGTGNKCHPQ